MSHSITLTDPQRDTLLRYYRGPFDPQRRLRAHILLLLADGHTWSLNTTVLYFSSAFPLFLRFCFLVTISIGLRRAVGLDCPLLSKLAGLCG